MRQRIKTAINHVTFGIGATLLVLMVLQISINAILRASLSASFPGTIEIVTNYYMVGFSFLPMALAHIQGRHVDANFLYSHMGKGVRAVADWTSLSISAVVVLLIIYQSYLDAVKKTKVHAYAVSGTSEIPIWICYWVLPVSFTLLLLSILLFPMAGRNDNNELESAS